MTVLTGGVGILAISIQSVISPVQIYYALYFVAAFEIELYLYILILVYLMR